MALQIPELEDGDFIRVRSYNPDEWPEPPHGFTFRVSVARKTRFLFWETVEEYSNSVYPVVRVDTWRNGAYSEASLQAAIDKLAAEYAARRRARIALSDAVTK